MNRTTASGPIVAAHQPITPVNGYAGKVNRPKAESLEAQRQKVQATIQAAEADLIRLQEEEQSELIAHRARRGQVREGHLKDAENFRAIARQETDEEEKRTLLRLAREDEEQAYQIGLELGLDQDDRGQSEEKPRLPLLKRPVVALLQVVGILAAIGFCYRQFLGLQTYIQKLNETLPAEKHLQPYDLTSIQKFFFEKLVVFTDLPVALVMLFLIVPFMGFYVLPFVRSKKDFYTEFTDELTPWQRTLITTIFCLGLLFFLAFSHTVKP